MGKPATIAQFTALRKIFIATGGDKPLCQEMMDDGTLKKFFENRVSETKNIRTFELTAMVNQNRDYIESLEFGGPDTPSHFNVREVGGLYLPIADGEERVDFVLRNFPKGNGSWDKALVWAKGKGLKKTNPREVFAVAEQNDLRKVLGVSSWMFLVTTTKCSFKGVRQAVCVFVSESRRHANLISLGSFGGGGDWFLFRK